MTTTGRVRVGTCGWDKKSWEGGFYPPGLRAPDRLRFASAHLGSLEVNTSFYGPPSVQGALGWYAQTSADFVFAVKGPSRITHEDALRNPTTGLVALFSEGVLLLEEKLGPILWQTPERLRFSEDVVDRFLSALPHTVAEAQELLRRYPDALADPRILELPDRRIRHAFEARSPTFSDPAFGDLLRRHDVAAAFTNSPDWPEFRQPARGFGYLRLHGDLRRFPDGYTDAALVELAETIDGWRTGSALPDGEPRDVFAYFDNPGHTAGTSPHIARRLQCMLDGPDALPPLPEPSPTLF